MNAPSTGIIALSVPYDMQHTKQEHLQLIMNAFLGYFATKIIDGRGYHVQFLGIEFSAGKLLTISTANDPPKPAQYVANFLVVLLVPEQVMAGELLTKYSEAPSEGNWKEEEIGWRRLEDSIND